MQRVIYVGGPNICFNVACRQAEEDSNVACRQPPGPLKHSMLLAPVGIPYRRENTFSKGRGSLPCTQHWITFSLSYSSQGHMSSAHCAAGDLTVLPVCFSTVVTYTGRINEYGEDRQYLSQHAISTTSTGQRACCPEEHFLWKNAVCVDAVFPMHLSRL